VVVVHLAILAHDHRERDSDVADRVVSGVVLMFQSLASLLSQTHPLVAQLMQTIESAVVSAGAAHK
jgi:hypothetical protein